MQEAVLPWTGNDDHLPKTVREFREEYKGVSRILDKHPGILVAAHEDLKKVSHGGSNEGKGGRQNKRKKGRSADFTSENILRALVEQVIDRHEELFGERPKVLAGDKGFCPEEAKCDELAEQVETLAIPRRMRDFADKVLAMRQKFRAGIEGTISGLLMPAQPMRVDDRKSGPTGADLLPQGRGMRSLATQTSIRRVFRLARVPHR